MNHSPSNFVSGVPGLLGALADHGTITLGVEHLVAAARGIAAVTPLWQVVPVADKPLLLTCAIARHIEATVTGPHR